ncbi:MAG: peptide chain release factor N(5)-glutamine methyltransferase [Defluviitaleaceae bacterium]|nr:peptide chain release factor N(5)-glutamine methyltransferase [Defluviitaleaceae bacterium]
MKMSNRILENVLKEGKRLLREAGIISWALDADIIMAYVLKISREQLITKNKYTLSIDEFELFHKIIEKRRNFMPIAYIINHVEFMGLDFYIDENVLIPRPDTETLVEAAIKSIMENNVETVLDICTGSGAIGISIAHHCPQIKVTLADISRKALDIARINSEKNSICIDCIESDMFENIEKKFDLIVSNPPYISKNEMAELPENVANYEPHMALYGGEDGLLFYRVLAKSAKNYLTPAGKIFVEIGSTQKNDVIGIFGKENFIPYSSLKDLAGLDRTLIFGKNIK